MIAKTQSRKEKKFQAMIDESFRKEMQAIKAKNPPLVSAPKTLLETLHAMEHKLEDGVFASSIQ